MTDQSFELAEETRGDLAIIAVSGEVDVVTAPTLRDRLDDQLAGGQVRVVVDLSGVTFLDSTGLGVLVRGMKRCSELGGELILVATEPRILKLFAITGLNDAFSIVPSLDSLGRNESLDDAN